jgi:hypothetical protein
MVLALALSSCLSGPVEPSARPLGDAEITVLFVGNSLTAANDLPGMVASIAVAAGRSFESRTVARPNFSLEDHWYAGVDATIGELRPDVVVLQQGPSSVGTNPQHLKRWAETLAPVVRDAGARPALLMVWPERARLEAFDAVRESYRAAAEAVEGDFIPAGEAWRAVWEADPDAALYGADGFHPSRLGTFVAALAVFEVLFDEDVRDLPAIVVEGGKAATYYDAVHAAVERWAAVSPEGLRSSRGRPSGTPGS